MVYLDPGLRQPQSLTEFLPHKGVWVVRLLEQSLQLVELFQREVGSAASLFDLRRLLGIMVLVFIRVLRVRRDAALRVIVCTSKNKTKRLTIFDFLCISSALSTPNKQTVWVESVECAGVYPGFLNLS